MQMIFATPVTPIVDGIAAQARRRGTILVIVNDREFSRVPGLKTEDWLPSSPQPIATLLLSRLGEGRGEVSRTPMRRYLHG
jgi:hypothetical protein